VELVGYADRFSVQPGETVRFMVSSRLGRYRARLIRLYNGDTNPAGAGFRAVEFPSAFDGEYEGREQAIRAGSYVEIPDCSLPESFIVSAWMWATAPDRGRQTIFGFADDFGLFIDSDGVLSFQFGETIVRAGAIRPREWQLVIASIDLGTRMAWVARTPLNEWPHDPQLLLLEQQIPAEFALPAVPGMLIGATRGSDGEATAHFNGKIEQPRVESRSLGTREIDAFKRSLPGSSRDLVGLWNFSAHPGALRIPDLGPNGFHGRVVNAPARGMTGHNWDGSESNPRYAPEQYGAIHFHEDDLDDARWDSDFAFTVPADLPSGVYAAQLTAGEAEDFIPFFVRPPVGQPGAKVALLFSTLTYLAYANIQGIANEYAAHYAAPRSNPKVGERELAYQEANNLLSLYDFHTDGSGVHFSSRLRPILNFRPKARMRHIDGPHGFPADLFLVDWLDRERIGFDAITDEDLHHDGQALLEPYEVLVTGSHPEYWSGQMLDAVASYLANGGRVMYLGGNGFYWVTSIDPARPHLVEVRRWGGTNAWQAEPGEYHHQTTGELGGLWRNRGRAPQKMLGVGFTAQGFDIAHPYYRTPESRDPKVAWIFEGLDPDEPIGDCENFILGHGAAGHEIDRYDLGLGTPVHTVLLATATGFSDEYQAVAEEVLMSDSKQGGTVNPRVHADMVYLEYPRDGAVFSVGSIAWIGALSANDFDNSVALVTGNVLRRFAKL
jgi:N,N-dimethylformamidase